MQNKKIIRFVESLVLLPVLSVSMPTGPVSKPVSPTDNYPQIVLAQKQNISVPSFLSFNQAKDEAPDPQVVMLERQAEAIDAYYKSYDMPLYGMGKKMAEEALKNNLDYRLVPAIAVRESTGGKHDCTRVTFNPFGWGSCKIGFKSNEQAIETVARNLAGNNPRTAQHYGNKTVKQILQAYNPPSVVPLYADQVMKIMEAIGPAEIVVATQA